MTTQEITPSTVTPRRLVRLSEEPTFMHPAIDEERELDSIIAGYGSCMACDCRGYIRDGDKPICKTCGHAFSRHS